MKLPTADRYLTSLPTQLRIWSASSLAAYMACPRRYYYQYVERWGQGAEGEEKAVDLAFGDFVHQAHDVYIKAIGGGADPETATELAVAHTLEVTWPKFEVREGDVEPSLEHQWGHVWGGTYRRVWRCDGKVMGEKGRPVKCPRSKKWNEALTDDALSRVVGPRPPIDCPDCGQKHLELQTVYFPDDKVKNRHTLIRSVIALCDELTKSSLTPVTLPDGRIGSELEFLRELSLQTPDGTPYMIVGSFDGLSAVGDGSEWILPELKTTRREPNRKYFSDFLPSAQIYTYTWAAYHDFPEKHPKIWMVVIHLGVGFTNVILRPLRVPPEVLEEWEEEMCEWIKRAEHDAEEAQYCQSLSAAYPRNPTACHGVPGSPTTPCPFLDICTLSPSDRGSFLRSNFHTRPENAYLTPK